MSSSSTASAGIAKPHKHDVLLGRGGASNHHHGNAVFRSVVSKTRPMYRRVPKHQKIIVARSIVHAVGRQDPPGRFLERKIVKAKGARGGAKKGGGKKAGQSGKKKGGDKGKDDNLWYEVPFERAVEKAKQALRERGKDEEDSDDDNDNGDNKTPPAAATGAGTALGSIVGVVGQGQGSNLSAADEATATPYRNMLSFGVAPSVVRSKMENESVAPGIIQAVLSGGGNGNTAQPERHVQFASGTQAGGSFSYGGDGMALPAKRRVSSVLMSMLGFADDGNDEDGGGLPMGLPREVLDVIEEITPEGDEHTGPAAAAAEEQQQQGQQQQRRRSSIFNLFRRKSRSVEGGALTFEQRSCASTTYDSEMHRRLLEQLEEDGVDVHGDGDGGDGRQRKKKRKASGNSPAARSPGKSRASLSIVRQQQQQHNAEHQQQPSRSRSIAEAAALVAAETELEELEPEDAHAPQQKRISFSPALFGGLFGSFTAPGGNVDGAGNPVKAPGTTTADQQAGSADADGGLLRQSTTAARRSLVATMNLFQSVTGKEDPLAGTNRSEGSFNAGDGGGGDDGTSEPRAKRRRRSTWLSGLRFSTMPAAVESATSAVAAAQAVQDMDLVKDDE